MYLSTWIKCCRIMFTQKSFKNYHKILYGSCYHWNNWTVIIKILAFKIKKKLRNRLNPSYINIWLHKIHHVKSDHQTVVSVNKRCEENIQTSNIQPNPWRSEFRYKRSYCFSGDVDSTSIDDTRYCNFFFHWTVFSFLLMISV